MMGRSIVSTIILLYAFSAFAEAGYTNHAGNVVAGWPVKLTQKEVTLAEGVVTNGCQLSTNDCRLTTNDNNLSTFQLFNFSTTNTYPLSIFPESEQRRIAADFGQPRVPVAVKRAITGAEKAMARSRKRRCRPQELPRQAGQRGHDHPRRAKGSWALTPRWLILTWAGHTVSAKMV